MSQLQDNNTNLQNILNVINSLPDANSVASKDAVLYTVQTLTDDQKAQARANIDAASIQDYEEMGDTFEQVIQAIYGEDVFIDEESGVITSIRDIAESVASNEAKSKVNVTDIINNLITNVSDKPLSAAQGVALKALIDAIQVPTKTSQLTNDSNFLTSIPSEYVTDTELNAKGYLTQHQDLSDYAKKSELPTVPTEVSAFTNDAGYIKNTEFNSAVNEALSEAKASGEFDGKNGISATHSWNGTTLTVTSASGTSSADLKGETGKSGVYVGSGTPSEGENVQINPEDDGNILTIPDVLQNTGDSEIDTMSQKAITELFEGISLGVASDNLIYIFINGNPVGTGVLQGTGGEQGDVYGYIDENNTVVLRGDIADGTYSIKYEMEDGEVVNIGNLVLDTNVYYSVISNLTNCTNSNSARQVVEGGGYSATITANNGYELKSVSVTMGGQPVSVSGGVINIISVTGDITITAVAETVQTGLTNLLPLAINADGSEFVGTHANGGDGYEYGYRINSSGQQTALDGLYCTGFMPITSLQDYIYIANIVEYTTDNSRNRIYFYDESKNPIGGTTLLVENTSITYENGVYKLKPFSFISETPSFFRFSCGGITDETIVTVNEPITDEDITTPVYTNMIPLSTDASGNLFVGTNGEKGYKTGYRLSLSSGNESALANYEVTGFIPAKCGDDIYIKDIDLTNENNTNIDFYQADKTPSVASGNKGVSLYHFFVTNGTQSNGVYKGTIRTGTLNGITNTNVAYIRIGSKSITDDSIVTVNQPIV